MTMMVVGVLMIFLLYIKAQQFKGVFLFYVTLRGSPLRPPSSCPQQQASGEEINKLKAQRHTRAGDEVEELKRSRVEETAMKMKLKLKRSGEVGDEDVVPNI